MRGNCFEPSLLLGFRFREEATSVVIMSLSLFWPRGSGSDEPPVEISRLFQESNRHVPGLTRTSIQKRHAKRSCSTRRAVTRESPLELHMRVRGSARDRLFKDRQSQTSNVLPASPAGLLQPANSGSGSVGLGYRGSMMVHAAAAALGSGSGKGGN